MTPKHLLWALAGVVAVAVLFFVLSGGPWLITRHPSSDLTDAETLRAQNDVRTTLVQTVGGLALAGGLVFTYRTYKLNQSQQVTEAYTKAVEQLGHNEAPVRLGAMYSLEHLAQDNPPRRQTVVDVLCAYLRMPYTPLPDHGEPAADSHNDAPVEVARHATANGPRHDPAQELQVRQTAQRLLADHLRHSLNISHEDAQRMTAPPEKTFWPDISLDLTGATLVQFDLFRTSVSGAKFSKANFIGAASFDEASFADIASFDGATFFGAAWFKGASFAGTAWFERATFRGAARFDKASFAGTPMFDGVRVADLDHPDSSKGGKNARWVWPKGWTVCPDEDDSSRGTLVSSTTGAH